MKQNHPIRSVLLFIAVLFLSNTLYAFPFEFTDKDGRKIRINKKPERVVSIVPSITESIVKIGVENCLKGATYHSLYPLEAVEKGGIGGFFSPSAEKIKALNPDLIFISDLHHEIVSTFGKGTDYEGKCTLINFDQHSYKNAAASLKIIGKIFNKEKEAEGILAKNRAELEIIRHKTNKLVTKKRVIRLMGRDRVMTPGDDSFQNDMIQMAGCIPPKTGQSGKIVPVTLKQWLAFNPQAIYGCGDDRKVFESLSDKPGWNEVDAVKNNQYFSFPCELTCRAATNVGYFSGWLAARVYPELFSDQKKQVKNESVVGSRPISINLPYVSTAGIKNEYIYDFINKTLLIELKDPMALLSTLEGYREKISTVGNHYFPTQTWGLGHTSGLKGLRERTYSVLNLNEKSVSLLFTGADMDNLTITEKKFKKIKVISLVTAGVRGNALKLSKDNGGFYEPGTINIILMTNMKLTKRAMTRAVITATEAKSAALSDMDIRSSYSPLKHQATGTGTDNIIVVEGKGATIDNTGGHSKMGELIAGSVYDGVKEAVFKQNGIVSDRNIFQRLKERKIKISALANITGCDCNLEKSAVNAEIEKILLDPYYSAFLESAFSISDDYERGIISNIDSFSAWSESIANEIAGRDQIEMRQLIEQEDLPVVLKTALNAIINGVVNRL